ncbi:MAG: hypothetical protein L0H70_08795, partial [Xanthomonadales bacterium]|nr:hypothetical protein [Xanthomonadales bacterium]
GSGTAQVGSVAALLEPTYGLSARTVFLQLNFVANQEGFMFFFAFFACLADICSSLDSRFAGLSKC